MLDLVTVAYNKPWLIEEQARLLAKHLVDDHILTVFDNSSDSRSSAAIADFCRFRDINYQRSYSPEWLHNHALNRAAAYLHERGHSHIGFLDHDVFPRRPTTLLDKIEPAGFYGVGQRHSPTDSLYLWPGFTFFSRWWLEAKLPLHLNFDGIRGARKADDGDCGSMNAPLFVAEDWSKLFRGEHGYRALRPPDSTGLQSWGYEVLGSDWLHLSNGSGWMAVPDWDERERLCRELLEAL